MLRRMVKNTSQLAWFMALLGVFVIVVDFRLLLEASQLNDSSSSDSLFLTPPGVLRSFTQMKNKGKQYSEAARNREPTPRAQNSTDLVKTRPLPRLWVFIPTVPRMGNPDYLLQVLSSMESNHFPMSNVFVFHMANNEKNNNSTSTTTSNEQRIALPPEQLSTTPNQTSLEDNQHVRFQEARKLFPRVHYKTVTKAESELPAPPPNYYLHGIHSVPLDIRRGHRKLMQSLREASQDNEDRKNWRRKECFDFLFNANHVLNFIDNQRNKTKSENMTTDLSQQLQNEKLFSSFSTVDNDDGDEWIILNQDDGKWNLTDGNDWRYIARQLQELETTEHAAIVGLCHEGAVSVAFQINHFRQLVALGDEWCNWLPVDWMISAYPTHFNTAASLIISPNERLVVHLGTISTKHGRVQNITKRPIKKRKHIPPTKKTATSWISQKFQPTKSFLFSKSIPI